MLGLWHENAIQGIKRPVLMYFSEKDGKCKKNRWLLSFEEKWNKYEQTQKSSFG